MQDDFDYRQTGFQSPCAEYAQEALSLDQKFLQDKSASFFIRLEKDSAPLGTKKNDILLINKAKTPKHGDLIVAVIQNEFTLGRYIIKDKIGYIWPQNQRLGDDEFNEDFVWGVAQSLHRDLCR